MEHEEFIQLVSSMLDDYYWIPELDSKVYKSKLNHYLSILGLTQESWYEKYVPNPGCKICGARVELFKVSRGWYATCGEECRSKLRSFDSTKIITEQWKDPEFRRQNYLGASRSKGITHSEFYILNLGNSRIKFGVSHNVERRSDELDGDIVYRSGMLTIEESSKLELDVATKFDNVVDSDCIDGNSEVRDESDMPSILEFIKLRNNND